MLESIRLIDFISHKDTNIRFGDGITVFVGRNGSGKSSVIDAITYAFYGKHIRSSNKNLVRYGAQRSSVVLEFSINNKRYRVEKRMNIKGQLESAVLYELKDGSWKRLVAGERRQFGESISDEITSILGLDYERMRVAAIIQQGEIGRIVESSPKEIKDLINSVIGIGMLENAYTFMRDVIDSFRARLRKVYGYDDTSKDTLLNDVNRYSHEIEVLRQMLDRAEDEKRRITERKIMLDEEYKEMGLKKDKFESMKVHITNLLNYIGERKRAIESNIADLRSTISNAEECLTLVEQEEDVKAALADAERMLTALNEEIDSLKQSNTRLEMLKRLLTDKEIIASKAREQMDIVDRLKNVPDELSTLRARLLQINNTISTMNREMGKLNGMIDCVSRLEFKDNICPVCGSKVESINPLFDKHTLRREVEDISNRLKELNYEKSLIENRISKLEKDNEYLQRAKGFLERHNILSMDDLLALENEIDGLRREVEGTDAIRRRLYTITLERDSTSKRVEEFRRKMESIIKARAFLDAKGITDTGVLKRFNDYLREYEALLARLNRLLNVQNADTIALSLLNTAYNIMDYAIDGYSTALVEGIRALVDECRGFSYDKYYMLKSELNRVEKEESDIGGELSRLRGRLDDINNDLTRIRGILNVLDHASNYITTLSDIRDKVFHRDGRVARNLRYWALQHISEKASEYARTFAMGISRIELTEEKDREKGGVNMLCYGTRGTIDITSMSGGEKVAVALALRFAIAYVMGGYKLDFIIMDEPTVHLDEERRASMVELIKLFAEGSALKQIIIITHDSEIFEDANVDHLYRFEMTDNGTQVSKVG
ncbi:MAG: AAA family ATPase [Candidatus Nitrosocaldus sp.]